MVLILILTGRLSTKPAAWVLPAHAGMNRLGNALAMKLGKICFTISSSLFDMAARALSPLSLYRYWLSANKLHQMHRGCSIIY
jgi:hypothetical protein